MSSGQKRYFLQSSCVVALMLAPALAYAQPSSPGAVPDNQAQVANTDEIVVTGIRGAARAAQEIKRNAPTVVEAITAQDLGKFTDASIADALQRVPGVNIERTSGTFDAGEGVTIRGLGAQYSTSTLNGRSLLGITDFTGGGGRQFDFSTVPPEVLGGVSIYKTSTSSQVEPGLAGQVNLQTLRPLDYKRSGSSNLFGSATVSGAYETRSKKISPRIGGIIGGKFLDGTLGAYVSVLYANQFSDRSELQAYLSRQSYGVSDANGNVTQYKNALTPGGGFDMWNVHEDRQKRAVASGVQWKPSEQLEVNIDFEYNDSRIKRADTTDYFYTPSFDGLVANPGGLTLGGNGHGIIGFDTSKIPGIGTGGQYIGELHIDYDNQSYNGGGNVVWKTSDNRLKIIGDVAYGKTDYFIQWLHPYIANDPLGGNSATGNLSTYRPSFTFGGPADASNPASYTDFSTHEYFQKRDLSDRVATRFDIEGEVNRHITLKAGARYERTNSQFLGMSFKPETGPTNPANIFSGQNVSFPFFPSTVPEVSFQGFCASNAAFCNQTNRGIGSLAGGFPTSASGSPGDVFGLISREAYKVQETNVAFYGQGDFQSEIFHMPLSGNVGVRGVRITEDATAFQGVTNVSVFVTGPQLTGNTQPVSDHNSYWRYLPSVNLTLKPRDNINVRLAAGKTISLPDYKSISPSAVVTIPVPSTPGGYADQAIASSGNTKLKPVDAWNYDATVEYYTRYGGSVIASGFYKDVKNLIIAATEVGVTLPGQGDRLFNVTTTSNASRGYTYGAEVGTNQPFTFLPSPWDGFGVQGNYTYVVSRTYQSGLPTQFPGSSKHNVNLTAYYEKFGFSLRAAYSYRNGYLSALGSGTLITRAQAELDLSASAKVFKNLEILVTGTNVNHSSHSTFSQEGGFTTAYFTRPTTYSVGLRGSF